MISQQVWGFGPTEELPVNEYPKWVQRAPHIGPVLCRNKAEEDQLLADWHAEQEAEARKAAEAAEAEAAAAKEQAELTLKPAAANPGGDVNAGKKGK